MTPEEAERIEAVIRADDRVADVAVLVDHDRGVPTTYVVVGAHPGYEGKLPIGEYLERAGLMDTTGARYGMIQMGCFPRTAATEVDRAILTATIERWLAAGD
jgi:hypothetical protein